MSVSSLMEMKLAEAASAHASRTNESNKCPARLSRAGAVVAMSAMSWLFAWLAAGTLRRCGAMAEAEVFSGVLWGLSPLICVYLCSWTAALCPAPRAKGAARVVFARAACLLLLGAAADKLIAPIAGAAAIVIAPLYSAFACGRALAEQRQRAGTERWSAATVASTPSYQSQAEEREERESKDSFVRTLVFVAVYFVACMWILVSWVVPDMKWEAPSTEAVFFLTGPLFLYVRLMLPCIHGSPALAVIGDMQLVAALIGVICWLVVAVLTGVFHAEIAGTVVFWIGELGVVGLFGYFLAVEAHYKQLMIIERRKPRRAKDASGMLDGRDSGDACSAHIDAAAGVCVDCVDY